MEKKEIDRLRKKYDLTKDRDILALYDELQSGTYDLTGPEGRAFDDEVYDLAREGYDVVQMANAMNSHINLMLIKLQEMNKLGYDLRVPIEPDGRFLRKIRT